MSSQRLTAEGKLELKIVLDFVITEREDATMQIIMSNSLSYFLNNAASDGLVLTEVEIIKLHVSSNHESSRTSFEDKSQHLNK